MSNSSPGAHPLRAACLMLALGGCQPASVLSETPAATALDTQAPSPSDTDTGSPNTDPDMDTLAGEYVGDLTLESKGAPDDLGDCALTVTVDASGVFTGTATCTLTPPDAPGGGGPGGGSMPAAFALDGHVLDDATLSGEMRMEDPPDGGRGGGPEPLALDMIGYIEVPIMHLDLVSTTAEFPFPVVASGTLQRQ